MSNQKHDSGRRNHNRHEDQDARPYAATARDLENVDRSLVERGLATSAILESSLDPRSRPAKVG